LRQHADGGAGFIDAFDHQDDAPAFARLSSMIKMRVTADLAITGLASAEFPCHGGGDLTSGGRTECHHAG
jgi:hypothetical protein